MTLLLRDEKVIGSSAFLLASTCWLQKHELLDNPLLTIFGSIFVGYLAAGIAVYLSEWLPKTIRPAIPITALGLNAYVITTQRFRY